MSKLELNVQPVKASSPISYHSLASSGPPTTEWDRTYAGRGRAYAYSNVQTEDGGYALAGSTSLPNQLADLWLAKTDVAGNLEWNRTYGGTGSDAANSVVQTVEGGYAIGSYTDSFGVGKFDFWLVKTDNAGNHQWNKTYGGTGNDYARSMIQTSDEGYAITGETRSFGLNPEPNVGAGDFWLVKTDSMGNEKWSKTYGGTDYDSASSVRQTSDGGYIIAGSTGSFGAGAWDAWLVKTDASGNMLWNKTYGGADYDGASSAVQTSDGGYAFAGYTYSFSGGSYDLWLVKTNATGHKEWDKTYGGPYGDEAKSLQRTKDNGYVIVAYTQSSEASPGDLWLIKTDANGEIVWNKTYGGDRADMGCSIEQTSDGGYVVAGYTDSFGNETKAWLIKVAPEQPVGTVYIRADGSIDPLTAPIVTVDNITYTLTENFNSNGSGIIVEKDNIVIDGAGYTIQGTEKGIGIQLSYRNNVIVKNTEIKAFYYGIYLWQSSNNIAYRNTIKANKDYGLYIRYSFENSIYENNITTNHEYGIWLDNSSKNRIRANNISTNNLRGIYLESSLNNIISRNNIEKNPVGVYLEKSSENKFYHNNFIDNTQQVQIEYQGYTNFLDDGYPSGGNYWSDYTAVDFYQGPYQNETGSDGLGDTSYSIATQNIDRYPLVNAIGLAPTYPNAAFTYLPSNPIAAQTMVFDASDSTCQNGTIATYYWSFGDGMHGSGTVVTHSYPLYGSYNVTLTVYSNTRHAGNQTQLVTIRGDPAASFYYFPTINVTVGQSVTFDASLSTPRGGTIESYIWDFGDGNITSTTAPTVIHSFPQGKTYNATLTVLDSEGLNSSYFQLVKVWMPSFITISTSSSSTFVGFAVDINGSLYDVYGNGLENQTVILYYTFSGANTWVPITSDTTDQLGEYYINWIPPATGFFTVKAIWTGNATHFGATNNISLSTISNQNEYVFSVESNSTISALAFNLTSLELSFTVSGPTGTNGYVKVTLAKSLVSNIADTKVYLNDTQIDYTTASLDDSWLIHLTYQHSTHRVTINLGVISTSFVDTPAGKIVLYGVPIAAALILAFLYALKKKQSMQQKKAKDS
jgi:parallel beta-helix repeat protein